jgi:isocitrate/isopropylmalate dehydrogenase
VDAVLAAGAIRTADLGGASTTMQVGEAVAAAVSA